MGLDRSGSAALMLAEAPGLIKPRGARDFLYTEDVAGLRERWFGPALSRPRSRTEA